MVFDLYYDGVNLIIKCFGEDCNGEMLDIDGSNAGFGGDNNLLANLKNRRLSEERSFISVYIVVVSRT